MATVFQALRPEGKVTVTLDNMQHSITPICIRNMKFLCHIVYEINSAQDFNRPTSEVKVKVTVTPKQ